MVAEDPDGPAVLGTTAAQGLRDQDRGPRRWRWPRLAAVAQLSGSASVAYAFCQREGDSRPSTDDFWGDLFAHAGAAACCSRCSLGLIGFGLANLIRNTGAALGVGFVYFIVEIDRWATCDRPGSRGS